MTKYVSRLDRIPFGILTRSYSVPTLVRAVIVALFLAGKTLVASAIPACLPETVESYVSQGPCSFDGLVLSDFTYTASGTKPLDAGAVKFVPSRDAYGIDFSFQANWSVSGTDSSISTITWTLTNTNTQDYNGSVFVGDWSTDVGTWSFSGGGYVSIEAANSPTPNPVLPNPFSTAGSISSSDGGVPANSTIYAAFMLKALANEYGGDGTASTTRADMHLAPAAPEPGSLTLVGTAMLALGASYLRRHRKARPRLGSRKQCVTRKRLVAVTTGIPPSSSALERYRWRSAPHKQDTNLAMLRGV